MKVKEIRELSTEEINKLALTLLPKEKNYDIFTRNGEEVQGRRRCGNGAAGLPYLQCGIHSDPENVPRRGHPLHEAGN